MKKNRDRASYLAKNTAIFAISNVATKLITFFLVPLYTFYLTTQQYGVIDLLFTISSVLVPILTLNISEAIYRFSMDKDADNDKIMSISTILIIFCSLLGLVSIPILRIINGYSEYAVYFYFYIVTLAVSQIFLVNLKGQEKLKSFAIGNIINTLVIAILNVVFLVYLKKGILGYFNAYIISNIITLIYAFFVGKVWKNLKKFSFDKSLFIKMSKYSIVLIPTSFMWWIMNSSDRIMVTKFIGESANGLYAVSYKIPTILTTVAGIFNQAWFFSAVNEKDSEDKTEYTNKVFKSMYYMMFIIATAIITILKPFFKLYVSVDYFSAWEFVPFLIFGSVFMTLATFISTSYNVYKDSKGFLYSGIFGAIVNIILNFILIPKFNVQGAAFATCVSYIIVFIYRIIDTKKYVHIKFQKGYILPAVLLIVDSFFLFINNIFGFICQIIVLIITLIVYRKEWLKPMVDIIEKLIKKCRNINRKRDF